MTREDELKLLRELNAHATRERERMAREIDRLAENGRMLAAVVKRAIKYAREDRMVTPGATRLQRALDELERLVKNEDPPYVCPGCHATGGESCASGCIDADMEADRQRLIESGDYDWLEDEDD